MYFNVETCINRPLFIFLYMRRSFFIIFIFLAINFTSPNTQAIAFTVRHKIEYAQDDKSRELTDNEMLKNKVVMYMRLQILGIRIALINNAYGFNSS